MPKLKEWFVILIFLLATSLPGYAKPKSWTIRYKANLLASIITTEAITYSPFNGIHKGKLGFAFPRTNAYFSGSDELKMKDANNILKIVYSYVLGDSLEFFSDVELVFYYEKDPDIKFVVKRNPEKENIPNLTDHSVGDRFTILSDIIPFPCLAVQNPSASFKQRIIGFSLPADMNGLKFDKILMYRYSINLSSLLYDFVLKRSTKEVVAIIIQFNDSDKYNDLQNTPLFSMSFGIKNVIFEDMRKYNSELKIIEE